MRRKDFEILDNKKAYEFLDQMNDGVLTTQCEKFGLSSRPMNYVPIGQDIYFHGARNGEKLEGVNKPANFLVYKPLSLIPSYWSDELSGCPATALFQSVVLKGWFGVVEDVNQKSQILQKLMEKLQPEGGHLNFTENLAFYEKSIKQVTVFELKVSDISYKVKLGQNWDIVKKNKIRTKLLERSDPIDLETIKIMEAFNIFE